MTRRIPALRHLAAAVAAAAAVGMLYLVFVRSYTGQVVDQRAESGAGHLLPRLAGLVEPVLGALPLACLVGAPLVVIVVGLARRRYLRTALSLGVVAMANLTTQILKRIVLERPYIGATWDSGNTFPSGHATLAAAAVLAVLLVCPPAVRAWLGLVGAAVLAVIGAGLVAAQWHRPADVSAGILVASAWGSLAALAGRPAERPAGPAAVVVRRMLWAVAAIAVVVALVGMIPAAVRVAAVGSHSLLAGVGGLAGVVAVAAAVCAEVAWTPRR